LPVRLDDLCDFRGLAHSAGISPGRGHQAKARGPESGAELAIFRDVYGHTKLLGEAYTRAACPRHLIVRTCGLYGHAGALGKGGNFVETMCKLAGGDRPIRVVADQHLSPTSTRALTEALRQWIQSECNGVVHLAAPDSCTWHEFASAIVEHIAPGREVIPIPSSEYPTPAARPAFSALRTVRADQAGIGGLPAWREMLNTYLATRGASVTE